MKVVIKDVQNLRENGAYVAPNITELHQANYGYDLLLWVSHVTVDAELPFPML